ncbi:MAG: hypothetical protein GY863_17345, partial [bacterium]|nr:hypothetical protein [bacterium]
MKRSGKTVIICAALYFIIFAFIQCGQDDQEAETTQAQSEQADDQNEGEDAILLDSRTRELIGLKLAEVKLTDLDESFPVPGRIISNENNEVHVNTLIPARVSELMAKWGETVKKGQPLICLESIELGRKRADHQRAMAELELAETEYNRNKNLYEQQAVSQRQFLEAEAKKREAEINVEYTLKMLMLTGLSENDVLTPPDEHQVISGCSVH